MEWTTFFICSGEGAKAQAENKARGLRDSGYNTELVPKGNAWEVRGKPKTAKQVAGEEVPRKRGRQPKPRGPTSEELAETEKWQNEV